MRVLRASTYVPGGDDPLTVVMRDCDLVGTLEAAAEELQRFPGGFVITDVFEVKDGATMEEASLLALEMQRAAAEREHNMAVFYWYDAQQFALLVPGGVLSMTLPSPLDVADLSVVLRQLVLRPDYDHFQIIAISHDHQVVRMHDGEIEVTEL